MAHHKRYAIIIIIIDKCKQKQE